VSIVSDFLNLNEQVLWQHEVVSLQSIRA
jgi:hypothetical protein